MRQIKFRIWNGMEMVYDITTGKFGTFYVNPEKGDGLNPQDTACLTVNTTKYPNGTPLMQFTGLTDKNGKDIYEGDIGLRYLDTNKRFTDGKTWRDYWLIEWHDESVGFITVLIADYDSASTKIIHKKPIIRNIYSKRFNEIEIIGNIYENPELLK